MTVLVTGGSGFVGRNALVPLRRRGHDVHAVHSSATPPEIEGVVWHRADLTEPGQPGRLMRQVGPSHLLHFAWYAVPGQFWTSLHNATWVRASVELMQSFVSHGGRRVVMAGTCAEYDWRHGFCSEGLTPLAPDTLYGTAKGAVRETLAAYASQTGVSAAWGRIFFPYGPHEHPSRLVASVISSLLLDQPALCTHGNQVRDFLSVADVGDAFAALLHSDAEGDVNIGSGQPVSLKEIVGTIGRKLGRERLIELGARQAPPDEPPMVVADVRRLSAAVGWQPRQTLETGLDDAIAWWRQELAS